MKRQPGGLGLDAAAVAPLGAAQRRVLVDRRTLPVAVDAGGGKVTDPGEAGDKSGDGGSMAIEHRVAGLVWAIGRASRRERVVQYVSISVVAVAFKTKKTDKNQMSLTD